MSLMDISSICVPSGDAIGVGRVTVTLDMIWMLRNLKSAVAAWMILTAAASAQGVADPVDDLLAALATAEGPDAEQIVEKIASEWSRSGSAALDLLLSRGREALAQEDIDTALGHFTALIDHAPEFAEGYNARATAYFNARMIGPAVDDIRSTLALNPRHFGAMTGLAIILEDLGRESAALDVWREVQRLYPASPQAERAVPRLERMVEGATL